MVWEKKTYPRVAPWSHREVHRTVFAVVLQLTFLAFCAYRVYQAWSNEVWEVFENLLAGNPYRDHNTSVHVLEVLDQLMAEVNQRRVDIVWVFVIVMMSLMQMVVYMRVHPRISLLSDTLLAM